MPTLLVVDDEPSILHAFRRAFRDPALRLLTAATAAEGLELAGRERPDVAVLDVHLPDGSGLDLFARLQALDARTPVVFVTGHGTTEMAIEAMKRGAYDYLLKPLELADFRAVIDRALAVSRSAHVPAVVPGERPPAGDADVLVGRCPAMQEVYKSVGRVAPTDATVLVTGESGTGKELVARAIYQHSKRAAGPFLPVNCAAIPEGLLESELFGHERGAFTGAERRRVGKFEQCSGGTLFLDEVGDMTPLTQTKVLRVLQEQRFERVGGSEPVRTDVRLIAASNRPLGRLVAAGQFRPDLYYRLSVFTISLPPLRERGEDLALLVDYYLRRFGPELGREVTAVAPGALAQLRRHGWPGNVRELQSVLKQALLQARGPVLLPDFLPPAIRSPAPPAPAEPVVDLAAFIEQRLQAGSQDLYAEALGLMERQLLTRVLRQCGGNQVQAAQLLGLSRGGLRTKLRALGITIERSVCSDDEDRPD